MHITTISDTVLIFNFPCNYNVVSFNIHIQQFRPCFVFRHPTGLVRNVFLQPFTVNVWYCVIVVGIFVIGTTSFISYREANNSGKIRFVNLYTSHGRVQRYFFIFYFIMLLFSSLLILRRTLYSMSCSFLFFAMCAAFFFLPHHSMIWCIIFFLSFGTCSCIALHLMYYYCVPVTQNCWIKKTHTQVFRGNHSLTNRSGVQANVPSTANGSKNTESRAKLNRNGDTIAMQSQQQTRRRHQASDSMLNTVQLKQHEASMAKQETAPRLCWNQQKQTQIIPEENVIIGICTKLFRKCFFTTQSLPASVVSVHCRWRKHCQVITTKNSREIHSLIRAR